MKQVICVLPNASELISGVRFSQVDSGMLSEEISEEQAAAFTEIPGYSIFSLMAAVATAAAPVLSTGELAALSTEAMPTLEASAIAALVTEQVPALSTEQAAALSTDAAPALDIEALTAKAVSLGIEVKKTWGAKRIESEISRVEAGA